MLQRYFLIIVTCLIFSLSSGCVTQSNNVPSDTTDYTNMAWDALNAGNYDRAIDYSSRAISQNNKIAESYMVRGWAYAANGNYARALQDLSMSISLEGNKPLPYIFRGEANQGLGNFFQAREDYQKGIELLVVVDDASRTMFDDLIEALDDLKDIFWAWEWIGIDPVESSMSYKFIFMEDFTGSYTVYRSGYEIVNSMRQFKCDDDFITVDLGNGNYKQYPLSIFKPSDKYEFIIDNWNDSGKKLILGARP